MVDDHDKKKLVRINLALKPITFGLSEKILLSFPYSSVVERTKRNIQKEDLFAKCLPIQSSIIPYESYM